MPNKRRFGLASSLFAMAAAASSQPAASATCTWNGGTGLYSDDVAWSCGHQPVGGDDVVITTPSSVVTISGINAGAGTVNLGAGNALNLSNGSLSVTNNAITNNGTVTIANSSLISASGTVTIDGTGTVMLDDSAGNARIYSNAFIFGAGQAVLGSGQLGINQTTFSNSGLVSASISGRSIDIDVSGGNGGVGAGNGFGTNGNAGFYNTGTLQATGGGMLNFSGGLYENGSAGVIRALDGSTVTLGGDSRILGGTLSTSGSGVINAHDVSQYLTSVTLASGSTLDVSNDNLYLNTGITNNGTIHVGGVGTASLIGETAATAIDGTGTIILDNSAGTARIYNGAFTFGAGQTVRGSGQVGTNSGTFVNNGLISADVSGGNIDIDVSGGSGGLNGGGVGTGSNAGLLNNAIIEAKNGGSLSFEGGLYENAGTIRATNGSLISLNGDSRIVGGTLASDGTSQINAHDATQYLTSVTLASGTRLDVSNDSLVLSTAITNNGTIRLSGAGTTTLTSETAATAIDGTGTIILDNSAGTARIYNSAFTFGAGQTVRGSGQIGINSGTFVNNGLISGDVSGGNIDIDVSGGSGGLSGGGFGTNGNAGLFSTGTIRATGGGSVSFEGGLYENSATGTLAALTNSTLTMNGDASLFNLQGGGVLVLGHYVSTTTGAASTLNLRSNGADSIVTIGTSTAGTDTTVTLSGAASAINVLGFGSGVPTAIDASLTTVAQSGRLELLDGRNFIVIAGGGAFANAGVVQLGGGTFGATSYTNSGTTFGNGTIAVDIANSGIVEATGGTLSTMTITGAAGTIRSDAGATLSLAGALADSTAGLLINNGMLALGGHDVTVTSDYRNANFGAGNSFNGRANVTGSGLILAASATQTLSSPGLTGNILNVGNVRIGGSTATILTVTNNGTLTTLRGAVQNGSAPAVSLSSPDFVIGPHGGSAGVTIGFTGATAGALSGQTLNVVNNFDNVADQTLTIQGNVYQVAIAGAQPASITLAASRVGDAASSATLTISNAAPNTGGYTEALSATASANNGFLTNGDGPVTTANLAPGASQAIAISHGTATSGSFSGLVSIGNTSVPVAGSGLSNLTLASQAVTVNGNVYAPAVANVAVSTVDFGPVRQGSASPMATVGITNGASGGLTDSLVTTIGSTPAHVSGTAPGALAAGQSGNATFALNTATAGVVSGNATLNFSSHDAELADLALPSQTVGISGTVTQVSVAQLFLNSGDGAFAGGGTNYSLNLGSFVAGAGSTSSDIGILNAILSSAFSEQLGGSFTFAGDSGFSFAGTVMANLAGGASDVGNLLTFDYTGLSTGTYNGVLTFNGYSHFDGLSNLALTPIQVAITAEITGTAPVPEPASWLETMIGLAAVALVARRRRGAIAKPRLAC